MLGVIGPASQPLRGDRDETSGPPNRNRRGGSGHPLDFHVGSGGISDFGSGEGTAANLHRKEGVATWRDVQGFIETAASGGQGGQGGARGGAQALLIDHHGVRQLAEIVAEELAGGAHRIGLINR